MMRVAASVLALVVALAHAEPKELNAATLAQIEQVRGIGVALAERLVAERDRRPFRDWSDLTLRVRGLGNAGAQRLSDAGWRIDGRAYDRRR
jgi:competence protein ComEA